MAPVIFIVAEAVQLICVIILFIITLKQKKEIASRDKEINDLRAEVDRLGYEVCRNEIKLTEEMLALNKKMLPIMQKIKTTYKISKQDKLCLLEFFVLFMQNIKRNMIYKVNSSKKYTFNEATDIIIEFIKNPIYTNDQVQDVLNVIFYLLVR